MPHHWLAAVVGIAAVSPSFAAQSDDIVIEQVVVTATRFEEPSTSQTIGVQVITKDEIRSSGALTVSELLERQTGIVLRDNSGSSNRQIDLRGFGVTGDQNTLILVDGQRVSENEVVPANLSAIALTSVDRIEIVRGSGAVLYGAGASAGVINIITRQSLPDQRGAFVRAGAGTYATRLGALSAELSGKSVGVAVNGSRLLSDNYRVNNELAESNGDVTLSLFGDHGKATLSLGSSDQKLRLPGSRTEAQLASDRRGSATQNDYSTLTSQRTLLALRQELSIGELALDLAYRERESQSEQGGGSANIRGEQTSVSPRLRARFDAGVAHTLVAGVDWEDWDYGTRTVFGGFLSSADSRQQNKSIYFKDSLELTPRTLASVGARWQTTDTELNDAFNVPQALTQSQSLRAYELALRYDPSPALSFYGRFAESFRMPTVDENRFRSTLLEPQTSNDREVGANYRGDRYSVRLSVYQMLLRDEILFLSGEVIPPFGSNVNLPPTRREGIELETGWQLVPSLRLGASYVYSIAKFREGNFAGADVAGNTVPLVPRHRAIANAAWDINERTRIAAVVTWIGEQFYDNDQSNNFGRKIPDYTVTDLSASIDAGAWTWQAALRNLFNEHYYSYAVRSVSAPTFNAYPAAERSLFLSADYRFGYR